MPVCGGLRPHHHHPSALTAGPIQLQMYPRHAGNLLPGFYGLVGWSLLHPVAPVPVYSSLGGSQKHQEGDNGPPGNPPGLLSLQPAHAANPTQIKPSDPVTHTHTLSLLLSVAHLQNSDVFATVLFHTKHTRTHTSTHTYIHTNTQAHKVN